MYLISLYFDEKTKDHITEYTKSIANYTKEFSLITECVPPHLTVAGYTSTYNKEETLTKLIYTIDDLVTHLKSFELNIVSIGTLKGSVLYLTPILNKQLQGVVEELEEKIGSTIFFQSSIYYKPYSYLPHITIARRLSKEQLFLGFEAIQHVFKPFIGHVVRIGLSTTNPYQEIKNWQLQSTSSC
ncbi:MAG: 2'-5' RNA ligase family protein [Lachnospiraceae bacterium]